MWLTPTQQPLAFTLNRPPLSLTSYLSGTVTRLSRVKKTTTNNNFGAPTQKEYPREVTPDARDLSPTHVRCLTQSAKVELAPTSLMSGAGVPLNP